MEVTYHPRVKRDVSEALRYYHRISPHLADGLDDELKAMIDRAARSPLHFHSVDRGFRRINLQRFPYHALFDVHANSIRVMVVRHNKRHPDYGMDRE